MLCIFMYGIIIKITKLQKKDLDIFTQMNALYFSKISAKILVCSPEHESVA